MVEFMQAHPNLVKGYITCGDAKRTSKKLLGCLTEELNGDGPPTRDLTSWKKVWADYKTHLKAKVRKNKLNISGTGGGPAKIMSFSPVELMALDLLQIHQAVDGMVGAQKFGAGTVEASHSNECENINTNTPSNVYVLQDVVEIPPFTPLSCSQPSPNYSTARSRTTRETNLLKMQVDGQKKFHKDCMRDLKYINHNLRLISKSYEKTVELWRSPLKLKGKNLYLQK